MLGPSETLGKGDECDLIYDHDLPCNLDDVCFSLAAENYFLPKAAACMQRHAYMQDGDVCRVNTDCSRCFVVASCLFLAKEIGKHARMS